MVLGCCNPVQDAYVTMPVASRFSAKRPPSKMSNIMVLRFLSCSAIALLAACGGGSGGGDMVEDVTARDIVTSTDGASEASEREIEDAIIAIESQRENDSNDATVSDLPSETFTISDQTFIITEKVAFADRVPTLREQNIQATYNGDGTITLSQGGNAVVLTTDSRGNFTGTDGDVSGFLRRRYQGADGIDLAFFNFNDATLRREGFVIIGNTTPSSALADLGGTATYTGEINARITGPGDTRPEQYDGIGGGRLEINFDEGAVSGSFNLTDPNAGLFKPAAIDQFPRISVELEQSDITAGTFGGVATVDFKDGGGFGNPDLALNNDGTYTGNFYGDAGQSAGGLVSGTIENAGETFVLQGAFAVD